MEYLPIFCDLLHRPCLIVGGGSVAERKARLLLDAGARLNVNALSASPQLSDWHRQGRLRLTLAPFSPSLLAECWLVIAATDDTAVNQRVSEAARAQGILCNVVDAPRQGNFIMPSIVDRAPLTLAISSAGNAPVLARQWRERLETLLPVHSGRLASYGGSLRQRVKTHFSTLAERRRFWERFYSHEGLAQALEKPDWPAARRITETLFNQLNETVGELALIGAGPGDAGLLTVKGLSYIQRADRLVVDGRVSAEIIALGRREAARQQADRKSPLTRLRHLMALARQGQRVVLLLDDSMSRWTAYQRALAELGDRAAGVISLPGVMAQ